MRNGQLQGGLACLAHNITVNEAAIREMLDGIFAE